MLLSHAENMPLPAAQLLVPAYRSLERNVDGKQIGRVPRHPSTGHGSGISKSKLLVHFTGCMGGCVRRDELSTSKADAAGKRRFGSLRSEIALLFGPVFLGSLLALLLIGFIGIPFTRFEGAYRQQRRTALEEFTAEAHLIDASLRAWYQERTGDLLALTDQPATRAEIERIASDISPEMNALEASRALQGNRASRDLTAALSAVQKAYGDYKVIDAVDARGRIVASTDASRLGRQVSDAALFARVLALPTSYHISDASQPGEQHAELRLSRAIMTPTGSNEVPAVLGAIIQHVSVDDVVTPFLSALKHKGETDEAVLVNAKGQPLTGTRPSLSRGPRTSPPERVIEGVPDRSASSPNAETFESVDYRGVRALAVYEPLRLDPHLTWGLIVKQDKDEVLAPQRTALRYLVGYSVLAFFLAMGMALGLARALARPIANLANAAARIEAGDLSARAETGSACDEVTRLVGTFNSMAARVQNGRQELEAQVRERTAELQRALAAKDQFLAVVSHELRNPLSPILAGAAVLRRTLAATEPRAIAAIAAIERNAKLQARLVTDLLDLSRTVRSKLSLQRCPVALDEIARSTLLAQELDLKRSRITLRTSLAERVWVHGDADRLEQVVANLLSNAIKFTPRLGTVTLSVARAQGSATTDQALARLVVEDTGIGMSHEQLPRVFQMFQQGEIGGRHPGLGIGLALVKSLVELHDGRVWAESDGPGKGSRFVVEIPTMTQMPSSAPISVAPPLRDAGKAPGRTVLVVEDNPDTRMLLAEGVEMLLGGVHAQVAASAEEALEIIRQSRPAMILSDIGLPGMDGYEMLHRAKTIPGMADVPAFAVTSFAEHKDIARARQVGYLGHFVKPVDLEAMARHLRPWIPSVA